MQNKDFCKCYEHLVKRKDGRYECAKCNQLFYKFFKFIAYTAYVVAISLAVNALILGNLFKNVKL